MTAPLVTVFGGSGFVGRYVVQRLARAGMRIRVGVRHPAHAMFLRPMGSVGQIHIVPASLRLADSVAAALEGADAAVNLVGILYERGRQRFDEVHVKGAERVASAAKRAKVHRLVHLSALGADPESPSRYARSKAAGEAAVQETFPRTAILRPSIVFGPEDDFFNRFARLAKISPVMPLIAGETRFQPVYVGDVADAVVRTLDFGSRPRGRVWELAGPRIYSFEELLRLMMREAMIERPFLRIPIWLARIAARFAQFMPTPPITPDQLRLLEQDNVASGEAPGLAELGISPTPLEAILPTYMRAYRPRGQFSRSRTDLA